MKLNLAFLVLTISALTASPSAFGQAPSLPADIISPARPVPVGKAPAMQFKLLKQTSDEAVYAIIFSKGDDVLSGLTDFALAHHIVDAHFTAIGAASSATLAYLDLPHKLYHAIPVREQCEVLSLIGDVAFYNDKPIVHMHAVLGRHDGSTVGGHVFELIIDPTLEVFFTANTTPLKKRPDEASGMKVIDPKQ